MCYFTWPLWWFVFFFSLDVAFLATSACGRFDGVAAAPTVGVTGQKLGSKLQPSTPRPREQAGVLQPAPPTPGVTQCIQTSQTTHHLPWGCVTSNVQWVWRMLRKQQQRQRNWEGISAWRSFHTQATRLWWMSNRMKASWTLNIGGNGGRVEGKKKITKGFLDVNDVEVHPSSTQERESWRRIFNDEKGPVSKHSPLLREKEGK